VISVQAIVLSFESFRRNHNWLKSLSFFFGPALRGKCSLMHTADFNQQDETSELETDVCIVGSGPAGLSVAKEFVGSSVRVLVVESGDAEPNEFADALNSIDSVGVPRVMDLVRARIFGGTSHVWSGRCAPFDATDYAERDWAPMSGWPVQMADLAPYVERASVNLGLGPPCYDESVWKKGLSLKWYDGRPGGAGMPPAQELDPNLLRPVFWQFSKHVDNPKDWMRFGPWFRQFSAKNVRILLNATVTQLNLADDGRAITSADVTGKSRKTRRIRAKAFVLCAGGVENPRLLLASNKVAANGIGNRNDLVGRYFMDHPRAAFATVNPRRSQALQDRFCVHRLNHETGAHYFLTGFGLSPALQKAERLLNCAGWLILHSAPDNPWDAVRRLRSAKRNLIRDAAAIGANSRIVMQGVGRLVRRMPVAHKLEKITLFADVEQRADRNSRVTLSDRKDPFGVPLPCIDWRINDQVGDSIRRLGSAAAHEFERLGLAKIDLEPWVVDRKLSEANFTDAGHPSGGTRMASDPKAGVVDEHCQVHGVGGLYVASSSVFPTNGHANPTLMIVALAIRVADRIKAQLF
jgi:choline dehydrogenase-like flavoprotein